MEIAHPKPDAVDNVRRLQPLRVLLSGQDRRFIRVTAFLLALRGYNVSEADLGEAAAAAKRHRSDVVLLESGSQAVAAQQVSQLLSLTSVPAVLLVTTDGKTRWSGQRAVQKWTPLDQLVDEIESASRSRAEPDGKMQ